MTEQPLTIRQVARETGVSSKTLRYTVYPPHTHPETTLLAFVEGRMDVTVGREVYRCSPGDRLLIPGNVEHAAVVGPEG